MRKIFKMSLVPTLIKLVLIENAGQTSIWLVTWGLCKCLRMAVGSGAAGKAMALPLFI